MGLEPDRQDPCVERGTMLALLPITATLAYYLLPAALQAQPLIQFAPQLLAYGAMGVWAWYNRSVAPRLGLSVLSIPAGLRWGLLTGILLGSINTYLIVHLVPSLGYDVTFLKDTPHARLPVLLMVPWFICVIAVFVEINFRGFLLGRLARLEIIVWRAPLVRRLSPFALGISTLTFAFDPFMVNTFRHLHWIAVWDGLIWGAIRLHTGNLWIPVVAHAVEVLVLYLAIRAALTLG